MRRQVALGDELAHHANRVARGVVVVGGERAAEPRGGSLEGRHVAENAPEPHVDVTGVRAVHPRDLHEAAERDGADAVLDPVARALPDRRREADVEAPRPHPEAERHEEVAELVDEDQHTQADDGDDDGHAG